MAFKQIKDNIFLLIAHNSTTVYIKKSENDFVIVILKYVNCFIFYNKMIYCENSMISIGIENITNTLW